jgi:hypothetical protein
LDEHHPDLFDVNGDPIFNDDAFDLEVLASRLPQGSYDKADLMALLGLKHTNVWQYVERGRLPRPAYYAAVVTKNGPVDKAYWTSRQVAQVLRERKPA